ncbi:MAG: hypothetical protein JST89_13695 [Cyanobacteria bacterium SZAS-4]|nr:hypothetical protein [Cyanobacteria bacterium SZAS-4]
MKTTRNHKILIAFGLILFNRAANASSITEKEVQQARLLPLVKHETKVGVIMCRDPQVEFNQQDWLSDGRTGTGGHLREHMLVDTVVNRRLLNMPKSDVDALFMVNHPDQWTPDGVIRYEVNFNTAKCGQTPQLLIEAFYNNKYKLTQYRSRYLAEGVNSNPIDSEWIK